MEYKEVVLTDSERISKRNYYKYDAQVQNYRNMVYIFNIAVENYLAKTFLKNDLSRIIWSDVEYAFRKRCGNTDTDNTLNLPFISYKLTDTDGDTDRKLFNNQMNTQGIYIGDGQVVIKTAPARLGYEVTFFCNRDEELIYAMHNAHFEASNETIVYGYVPVGSVGNTIKIPMFVKYDTTYNDQFSQMDYLKENKIRTLSITLSIDTYFLREASNTINNDGTGSTGQLNIPLVEEVILDFFNSKDINKSDIYASNIESLLRIYFSNTGETQEILTPPISPPVME